MKRTIEIYLVLIITIAVFLVGTVIASQVSANSLKAVNSKNINSATSLNSVNTQAVVSTNSALVSNSNEVSVSDKEYFRRELNLTPKTEIKQSVLEKLVQTKQKEKIKVERVLALAKIVNETKREKIAEELLAIKSTFLQRFETRILESDEKKENIKEQLENYIEVIEQKQKIKLNINDNKIKNLFRTKNIEEFMSSLFDNI